MDNNFDFTNEKTFKEDTIKGLLEKLRALREGLGETYMVKILTKIWPTKDGSDKNIAYAIAIAQMILNPKYDKITMSNTAIKYKIAKIYSEDETSSIEKEKSNEESNNVEKKPVRKCKNISKKISKTKSGRVEDQEELPEDLKEAEKEPEDNNSNNIEKEPVRKHKNISKQFGKA
ncbi:hypothetical protein F8M41_021067 [Gigaspora margarita]|uniref:Uncharacterized protein n=1 Tax=Gigaspora margarita TaxID=4874 RepID=A0A8H4EJA0_GIGMA|nr:hypothetical protein F8M41_021067 [Gigaspora margarita]